MLGPRVRVRISALLAVPLALAPALGAGCAPTGPRPGARLAQRVEAQLASPSTRDALKESPGHYGLVFPVAQDDLRAFMDQIRVFGRPGNLVLGTGYGLESHGGGLLALLLRHWRPEGRPAELSDRFPFRGSGAGVPLAALYASLRRQVFLPVPGRDPDAIAGELPGTPQLARVRFDLRAAGYPWPARDVDAYHVLALLAANEADPTAAWVNALGQRLSVRLLLEQAGRHYLDGRDTPAEPEDHSELHLVEVLLGAGAVGGVPPEAVQRRFLAVELQRRVFDPADETLLLGHYTESLGLLLADPRLDWSPEQTRQVTDWLAWLESDRFAGDLAGVAPRRLAHLLRGLRLVEENLPG